ncbi:hypothetical protein EI94DRAFT_1722118 [Lactarius quietus]|nr:hypothetical protein EI94DRAFT_1722118 [Lactarius quietus]
MFPHPIPAIPRLRSKICSLPAQPICSFPLPRFFLIPRLACFPPQQCNTRSAIESVPDARTSEVILPISSRASKTHLKFTTLSSASCILHLVPSYCQLHHSLFPYPSPPLSPSLDVPRHPKIHYRADTSRPSPTSKQLSDPCGSSLPFHPTTTCSFRTLPVPFTLG